MDSLEQKIREILLEDPACYSLVSEEDVGTVTAKILALLQPQQPEKDMNIKEVTERACKEPNLLDALAYICVWESERVVKQARNNPTWETCFRISLKSVLDNWV